jgi:predicted nucleotide-binding protein (sugar kinase/HSP70/actin superfamily)
MEEIADIALQAKAPPNFSDQCAAFISSDINTALQEGVSKENIVAGLVYSICINYVNRVKGSRQTGNKVFMQGGVCYNRAVPAAMAALTGKRIIVPPHPGLMGSYGVALEVKSMIELGLLHKKGFNLKELAHREFSYGKSFICQGAAEHCDRKCEIAMIHIGNRKFPFGGACNKYYNQIHNVKYDVAKLNHIETRQKLLYETFVKPRSDLKPDAKVVGINRSFHTNTLYPFYFNFFNELGFKVILPDEVHQEGIDKGMTSYCLSGQIALGMFDDLLRKKPDFIFSPHIKEMHVSEQKEYRIEYQTTCMFVQGEPWYQRATFLRDHPNPPKLLAPILNFMAGFDQEEKQFIAIATELGCTAAQGKRAHQIAFRKQQEFFAAMKQEGKRILAELEKDPTKQAVVLFGRPYNAFADEANKGVPFKFASRGIEIIPFDFLMYEEEENYKNTYWEMGQRIIKAARIVKRHPQLFGCYLTNFLCALDSIMVQHFRDLMGTKPSLTIEVDSHTADAGVNTRIEAFMDVVRNYLKLAGTIKDPPKTFRVAKTEVDQTGKVFFIDSDGKRFPITHPDVNVVVPSMGDLFAEGTAAVLRGLGWNAEGLPVCDREALDLGRSVTTGKECLPIINILGEILKHIKYRKNKNEKLVVMMVGAGGCCRVGQYDILVNTIAEKLKLRDVATLVLTNDDGYAGLGLPFRIGMVKALYTFDTMDDIRSAIKGMAIDPVQGMRIWTEEKNKMLASLAKESRIPFFKQLEASIKALSKIALKKPISEAKYIGLVGEIYVRRDHFSLMGIPERLAENGFVMLDAPVTEWIRYTDFLRDIKMYVAKVSFIGKIEALLSDLVQDYYEKKIKKMFVKTGLYEYELIHIRKYMSYSTHFFPLQLTGEPGLSSGSALYHYGDKYCGTISVGPFGCMNSRMTEAVATPEMTVAGKEKAMRNAGVKPDVDYLKKDMDILPFLSVELDGNPFSQIVSARLETFMMQADRMYEAMQQRKARQQR